MTAAFLLRSGYTIEFSASQFMNSVYATLTCSFGYSSQTSLMDFNYFSFGIASGVYVLNGDINFLGPQLGAGISWHFGQVTPVISLFTGLFAIITGLVIRKYPRIGGVMAILVVSLLLILGIPVLGLVPLMGTILIVIGGILGLTAGEL